MISASWWMHHSLLPLISFQIILYLLNKVRYVWACFWTIVQNIVPCKHLCLQVKRKNKKNHVEIQSSHFMFHRQLWSVSPHKMRMLWVVYILNSDGMLCCEEKIKYAETQGFEANGVSLVATCRWSYWILSSTHTVEPFLFFKVINSILKIRMNWMV